MPRFFFHVRSACKDLSRDELGLDYPDVETAYLEVFRGAQGMMCEFAARSLNPQDYAVEIENDSGEVVFELPFSEVSGRQIP
ncbi:hypothetical protein ILT44_18535 [Microvirga sp. BT689]|uniref:DUF6894 family protein n=1 Tax=Microvirga arvi TaxID=2778731 RepID=UPI001951032B|nr:hypothetical protein [Microvirga arvi]MBM6582204.1 hypothetical protein [Microvirga arvi]